MSSLWQTCVGAVGIALLLSGCAAGPDVDVNGPTLALDVTRPIFPTLKRALKAHPRANTFRVSWVITPNPTKPLESLPHFMTYNRKTKTLIIHRDTPHYEMFVGVTDAAIEHLAGDPIEFVRHGCKQRWVPEGKV